jgi:2-polyprenyl-3-methyl-5-hydroxy-6-metoxy-1,4-benzoquinol methylase
MLGYLFKLGEEVIGYNSINEAIELIRYYLEHEEERKIIALNGWKRALQDYSEEAVWELLTDKILGIYREKKNDGKEKCFERIIQIKGENKKNNIKHYKGKLKPFLKKYINGFFNRYGYEIQKKKKNLIVSNKEYITSILPYLENPEEGPINFEVKEKRLSENGLFEWPNIIALNQTVVSLLRNEKKILEVGSGTGCFAWHAAMDKSKYITASEIDAGARDWAMQNRAAENLKYVSKWSNEFGTNSFDLVVAVEIIEHLKDYSKFLAELIRIAPKAIITTPNKNRDEHSAKASPPKYYQHVREWTAGEFYWILKTFYKDVKLYSMPNVYVPYCVPVDITSKMTPVIGVCKK